MTLFISHNKPIGCGASGAYASAPDDEEDTVIIEWCSNNICVCVGRCVLATLISVHGNEQDKIF